MRRKRQFTCADLEKVVSDYEENFKKIESCLSVGDDENCKTFIRIENELTRLDKKIRKSLGIWAEDPCRLVNRDEVYCAVCSGYMVETSTGYSMVWPLTTADGPVMLRCRLKEMEMGRTMI